MYTLHFYAGTHGEALRDECRNAMRMGAAVFASEWGTSRADGSDGVFLKESDVWLGFLKRHDISWCNWSLGDRDETSAALKPGAPIGGWTSEDLTESGRYVFERLSGDIAETSESGE
jgi:endoglucanase